MIEPVAPPDPAAVDAVRALSRLSRIVERASDSLSPADYRVLSTLASGEARASRLAHRLLLGQADYQFDCGVAEQAWTHREVGVEGDNRAVELPCLRRAPSCSSEWRRG